MSDEFDLLFAKAMPLFFIMALLAGVVKALNLLFGERTADLFWETAALLLFGIYGLRLVYNQSKTLRGVCRAIHISLFSAGTICTIYGAWVLAFGFTTSTGYVPRSVGMHALITGGILLVVAGAISLISLIHKKKKK